MHVLFPMLGLERGGGCRVIVHLANGLVRRGHRVTVVMHRTGKLEWDLDAELVVVPDLTASSLPACDVMVANFWPTVAPAYNSGKGRMVRLSLGYEPLWVPTRELARETYRLPVPLVTVSQWLRRLILEELGVDSTVIPPGIDPAVFHPRRMEPDGQLRVLYMYRARSSGYWWKGQRTFFSAMATVAKAVPGVRLILVLPEVPQPEEEVPCPHELHHLPSDEQLAELYAQAHVFVSSSLFEAFALPPLEAMASGTPVVMTDSGGISEYAVHNQNALVIPASDERAMAQAITAVLRHPTLAQQLRVGGLQTAARLPWDISITRFEQFLSHVVTTTPRPLVRPDPRPPVGGPRTSPFPAPPTESHGATITHGGASPPTPSGIFPLHRVATCRRAASGWDACSAAAKVGRRLRAVVVQLADGDHLQPLGLQVPAHTLHGEQRVLAEELDGEDTVGFRAESGQEAQRAIRRAQRIPAEICAQQIEGPGRRRHPQYRAPQDGQPGPPAQRRGEQARVHGGDACAASQQPGGPPPWRRAKIQRPGARCDMQAEELHGLLQFAGRPRDLVGSGPQARNPAWPRRQVVGDGPEPRPRPLCSDRQRKDKGRGASGRDHTEPAEVLPQFLHQGGGGPRGRAGQEPYLHLTTGGDATRHRFGDREGQRGRARLQAELVVGRAGVPHEHRRPELPRKVAQPSGSA